MFPFFIVIFRSVSGGKDRTTTVIPSFKKIFEPLPHHHTFHFVTNQEAQLGLLLVLWYVLLPHLFHTPKCPYGSHLCVGAIQIETFIFYSLEKGWRGRIHFVTSCDLNGTFIFMSKFSMEACPPMKFELVVQRKEGLIFSYHVPKRPKA